MNPVGCENFIRNLKGTDSDELNKNSSRSSFIFSDRKRFQNQIEKRQTAFTVTKLNTVPTGVFTNQPNKYD